MSGRAIIAPLSFGDSSLPRIDITYVPEITGAVADFAADQLPVGSLPSWRSQVGATVLVADGATTPQVVSDAGRRSVRFNGSADRMQAALSVPGAHTVLSVARYRSTVGGEVVHWGASATEPAVVSLAGNDNFGSSAGGRALLPSPAVVPGTGWHVVAASFAGDNSALNIDGREYTGPLGDVARTRLVLGFGPVASSNRTAIDYRRVAVIPGTMSAAERARLVAQMAAHYGV